MGNVLDDLYRVAEDRDLEVLDRLSEKAGLIWRCRNCDWNNVDKTLPCEDCGLTYEQGMAGVRA